MIDPFILKYAEEHSSSIHPLLDQLERETNLKVLQSHMLSGKIQGNLLYTLCKLKQPVGIVEFGTYTGYATLCMAYALKNNQPIITFEKNDEIAEYAQRYFNLSGLPNIKIILGDALSLIENLDFAFDFAFIDADKKNNIAYYEWCIKKMPPGGIIIVDNVIWKGKVIHERVDKETQLIHEFNTFVKCDDRVRSLLLPLRDGLFVLEIK